MATPEGRVKNAVKKVLDKYYDVHYNMPVPYGYGSSLLDFVICAGGHCILVETKAPKKEMTPRQRLIAKEWAAAGASVFVISGTGTEDLRPLEDCLGKYARRKG